MFVMDNSLITKRKENTGFILNAEKMLEFKVKSLPQLIMEYSDEDKCIKFFEDLLWDGHPVSPFDKTSKVYKCKNNQYLCKNTNKHFNVKTGTVLENTKLKLSVWIVAIWMYTNHKLNCSSMQLSRDLGITQKSAWFVLHRLRYLLRRQHGSMLYGCVEIDETYIGGKNKNRHSSLKVKNAQGRSGKDKVAVFGMIERLTGRVISYVVDSASASELIPHIHNHIEYESHVYSDELSTYKQLGKNYIHKIVKHNEGQYVEDDVHTNTIENYWSVLKRGLSNYVHISRKHFQKYVDESSFRRFTMKFEPAERMIYLACNIRGRLRYSDLIKGCVECL